MAVYDQWHREGRPGEQPCKCGTARRPLYPGSRHEQGDRWQVRYRDLNGKQRKRSFAKRVGTNPDEHADAFDAVTAEQLRARTWTDPQLAESSFRDHAEAWRRAQAHKPERAADVEGYLRLHAYEGEPGSGRTPRGGIAIGQHPIGLLSRRPSLTQAWITAMPLEAGTARAVIGIVSAVYKAAIDDGVISRDPTRSGSVTRPARPRRRARPWTAAQVGAMRDALPARYAIIPELGAGTGMRQGEMFGLADTDIQFLGRKPRIDVVRQLKIVDGRPRLAPLKNHKPHSVPLAPSLALLLARHMELHPPVEVTLPWYDPGGPGDGELVTVRLVLANGRQLPVRRTTFDEATWHPALERAGIKPARERGKRRAPAREDGCHVLRHTFVSVQLRAHVDVVRVAAWIGDTPAMVLSTYAHLLPGDDDGDGRAAVDGFLAAACAPDVPPEEGDGTSSQVSG